jgi:hypothetical protein
MDASETDRSIGSTRQVAQLRAAIYTKSYFLRGDAGNIVRSLLGSGTFADKGGLSRLSLNGIRNPFDCAFVVEPALKTERLSVLRKRCSNALEENYGLKIAPI